MSIAEILRQCFVFLANLARSGAASAKVAIVVAPQEVPELLVFLLVGDYLSLLFEGNIITVHVRQPNILILLSDRFTRLLAPLLHHFIVVLFPVAVGDEHVLAAPEVLYFLFLYLNKSVFLGALVLPKLNGVVLVYLRFRLLELLLELSIFLLLRIEEPLHAPELLVLPLALPIVKIKLDK